MEHSSKKISAWDKNLDRLTNGEFGVATSPEALLRYWQAQAEAGYPSADENVKYFEQQISLNNTIKNAAQSATKAADSLRKAFSHFNKTTGETKMKYNKLVRDKIPEIISESGKSVAYRKLNEEEYKVALELKLDEEVSEFHENPSIAEIADIAEVLYALIEAYGYRVIDVIKYRAAKREEKGSFDERIFLEEVKDD